MKVFRINVDADKYQLLLPTSDSDEVYNLLESIDGRSIADSWKPLEFYIHNPLAKRGNFFALSNGAAFVCDEKAVHRLSNYLGFGSELLPIYLEDGTRLFILNVTDCVNALNPKLTEFDYYDDGSRGRILKFAFYKGRFSESSIFKIPETANYQVLTYFGFKSPEDEFYAAYIKSDLHGLEFEELFSDNNASG